MTGASSPLLLHIIGCGGGGYMNCYSVELHSKYLAGIVNDSKHQDADMKRCFLLHLQTLNLQFPQMCPPTYYGSIGNYDPAWDRGGERRQHPGIHCSELITTGRNPDLLEALELDSPMLDNLGDRSTSAMLENDEGAILHAGPNKGLAI